MSATPIPSARTVFVDQNGAPLVGGSVLFCTPGTLSKKTTWANSAQTTVNANPLPLDAFGSASVWGVGAYRQRVFNALGVLIWDSDTASAAAFGQVNPSDLTNAVNSELQAELPGALANVQGLET